VTLRIVPAANVFGDGFQFQVRVVNDDGENIVYSAATTITVNLAPMPDRPDPVYPTVMPTIEAGAGSVSQLTVFTNDPDSNDTSWTFRIAAATDKAGPYATTLVLPGKGTVEILDVNLADQSAVLKFTAAAGFSGRYEFWVIVEDSSGLNSIPVRITGLVVPKSLTVELHQLTRTSSSASLSLLCPLNATSLSITEALHGAGSCRLTASVEELVNRASALGRSVADLLDPYAVEVHVLVDGRQVFAGPITHYALRGADLTVEVEASGLLAYLESRMIESGDRTYVGDQESDIIWDLIDLTQAQPYGSLLLADGTGNTGENRTVTFERHTTIAGAIGELTSTLNGLEVWVDPDRIVRADALRGTDRRRELILTAGNTLDLASQADPAELATVVIVRNTDAAVTGSAVSTDALARYGRVVRLYDAASLQTTAAATVLAGQHLANRRELVPTFTVTQLIEPGMNYGTFDYGVGDAITIETDSTAGRVVVDARIINRYVTLTPGAPGFATVELDLEVIPRNSDGSGGTIRSSRSAQNPDLFDQVFDALYRR
jgi:hypothetical protein